MPTISGRAQRVLSLAAVVIATAVLPLKAVQTKFWQQNDISEFESGNLSKLSLRSDGRLSLAPVVKELLDSSTPYLWTVARDSKGNLYAGGGGPTGSTAKLFEVDGNGKSKVLAELDGLEIHAIAIDSKDRVYAATAPDGKVYRIHQGKPEVFYDPHAKYIWAMAFSKSDDLYIATGDHGDIHKVTPDGKGVIFFQTEETHARSLAMDKAGNLIVGTEPGGLIMRITPAGEGFVLYQSPKREITAVAVAPDGTIYATAVGNKPTGLPVFPPPAPGPQPVPSPTPTSSGTPTAVAVQVRTISAPPPSVVANATSVAGGSDLYRIGPDGSPRKIWTNAHDIAYTIALDAQGRPLVGTGNKGNVYRIESDIQYTMLVNLAPTQVTGFVTGPNGEVDAVTGNIGKLYRIGPQLENSGTYDSEPLDAEAFSYWGRLSYSGSVNSGSVSFAARSGNLNHPQKNWSPWSQVPLTGDGGRIAAPPARFLQYRATLTASSSGKSPDLREVDIAYMAKNLAPELNDIEVTPANYKFSTATAPSTPVTNSPQTITLPPLTGKKKTSTPSLQISSSQTMQYSKGSVGVRWGAQDENDDTMEYRVEIRGMGETAWKLLKEHLRDKQYSWDSSTFPDGEYQVRVTATDEPSNPPAEALTSEIVSDPFTIDNTPPQITGLTAAVNGSSIDVTWRATDALSVIDHAEYSVNGNEWTVVQPVTRLSDAPELAYRLNILRPASGEYTIAVRVADEYDNISVGKTVVK